jgi:hypothetical protein
MPPVNVPFGAGDKIGKAAPTARSGSGSGPLTGPMADDTPSGGESMHDPMPPPHFSNASDAKAMIAAKLQQARNAAAQSDDKNGM